MTDGTIVSCVIAGLVAFTFGVLAALPWILEWIDPSLAEDTPA